MSGISWFILALAVTALVAAAYEKAAHAESHDDKREGKKPIDQQRLAAAVTKEIAHESNPEKVEATARKLEAIGQPAAAAAVREHAANMRRGRASGAGASIPAPFPGVPRKAWSRYVRLMAIAEPGFVSPGNQLGMFQVGYPRLADLGYVENLRKEPKDGRTVWMADFKAPLTLSGFLADPALQYEVFAKAAKADRGAILSRHADVIGATVAGKKVTLSGLLATGYYAGLAGLGRWLTSDNARERARKTTAIFQRTTGLF